VEIYSISLLIFFTQLIWRLP